MGKTKRKSSQPVPEHLIICQAPIQAGQDLPDRTWQIMKIH